MNDSSPLLKAARGVMAALAGSSATVFVRNLPYDVADEQVRWCGVHFFVLQPPCSDLIDCRLRSQLAEFFAGVGPVRKSFVIKDKGDRRAAATLQACWRK